MTREECEALFRAEYNVSEEDMRLMGITFTRCWCGGRHPGCWGWQPEIRRNHSPLIERAEILEALA